MQKFAIAVHGGAGTIVRNIMTTEKELAYKHGLEKALNCGYDILKNGGTSIDAVEASVVALENNILFNAGAGSVFNHNGKHEMDAAIMCGKDLRAGAVAGVYSVKNPISLARAVMEKSQHVMLTGEGAIEFARQMNVPFEEENYFFSEERYNQWQAVKNEDSAHLDHNVVFSTAKKFGTVGAVAMDINGDLSAATSTGGMTNKQFGRIGDTPIIGAGTYANNNTCAISCTGHGEFFMRSVVAYDISCLMEYKGLLLNEACEQVVKNKLVSFGGEGGLIAVDKFGNIEMPFNTDGMYRACRKANEKVFVGIYK